MLEIGMEHHGIVHDLKFCWLFSDNEPMKFCR